MMQKIGVIETKAVKVFKYRKIMINTGIELNYINK